ncbi:FAD synthase-like [Panonychus citri]|uniref:FAD synthase-like n=1 Tax=Panonychus citri TaxID=50023 RepID=UPI002307E15F|nr:FAD synthase-like [Panonychus citri]XP_053200776.1 FAD synthase-like [Panonychus citri]XP_053201464.1 FAD synthase-like [Panonychus citri]XP_053201465.1 FAD synthase-like [Panonychus citri]XP_053202462.1 FAD synthase-like [Panonychus citri]XP_053202463.1 FAD synthase-like [Panonychus citri]
MLKQQLVDLWTSQLNQFALLEGNENVLESISVINKCLENVDCDKKRFCVSFNGGKDCTVLLHLVYLLMMDKVKQRAAFNQTDDVKLMTLLILMPDTFPELEEFIKSSVERYNLGLVTLDGPDFKEALKNFKAESSVSHIFMGTRKTDLVNSISFFEPTDSDWPEFIRVNPLLNWSYHQIWSFLRSLEVPYCSLYDKGYTSLGTSKNTILNPKLKDPSGTGYFPAYMLNDGKDERQGRYKY